MIELYCGDGKGKTTAALGLAVRFAGHGMPVIFAQFLKNDSSGEIKALKNLPQIQVMHAETFYGFTMQMSQEQKEEMRICYTRFLEQIQEKVREKNGKPVLVVLDEVLHACNQKLLSEQELCQFLDGCPDTVEIVLTGRNPSEALTERADYISEIKKIRHPYDKGIPAREGIEL